MHFAWNSDASLHKNSTPDKKFDCMFESSTPDSFKITWIHLKDKKEKKKKRSYLFVVQCYLCLRENRPAITSGILKLKDSFL